MISRKRRVRALGALAGTAALLLVVAGCSAANGSGGSSDTKGVTISVVLASNPPPASELAQFTKATGIKVKWSNIDWDSLQTKITAAASAKTYFADATDVDWSRVGQLGKLGWFHPMQDYLDTKALAKDIPQIAAATYKGKVVGIPYDSFFQVTTINKDLFAKAGITTTPTTIAEYTSDLQKVKSAGVVQYPLNIPFAAAEGLSTYWYQVTAAYGGTVLDAKGNPLFTSPGSAGYKAAAWMIDAMKSGLVPPGNINVTDSQGMQTLMAKNTVASTFSDYSGNVGSIYDVPSSSTVAGQVEYIHTPGLHKTAKSLTSADSIGIPTTAKYPKAAAKFISWFISKDSQLDFAGANGPSKVISGFALPARVSAVQALTSRGKLSGGETLSDILKNSTQPIFPDGVPTWYPAFSRAVNTNLHAAATGDMTTAAAIAAIAATTRSLASGKGS